MSLADDSAANAHNHAGIAIEQFRKGIVVVQ
jgi:hypothetical protein